MEDPPGAMRGVGALAGSASAISCQVILPAQAGHSLTYTDSARVGVSILQFDVPHDGEYTLDCADNRPSTEPRLEAAVGGKVAEAMFTLFLRSLVLFACGSVLAVIFGVA